MWQSMDVEAEGIPLRSGKTADVSQAPRRSWTKFKCALLSCSLLLVLVGLATVAIEFGLFASDPLDDGPCVSECPHCRKGVRLPPAEPLPTPDIQKRKTAPWYIATHGLASQPISYDPKDETLRVDYIPNRFGSDNGADFKSNPHHALPADSAVLSYSVYFPKDFTWNRGGKLPGLCISNQPNTSTCATGGSWAYNSGSARMMWREGGRAIGYTYIPLQAGLLGARWSAWAAQGSSYKRVASDTGSTGDDVFCKVDGGLRLRGGEWNEITVVVAMNTPGLANGWLSTTVNGETRTVKSMRWRGLTSSVKITSVVFASFFGGGDSTWAIDDKTYALFKDFKFAAPADLSASTL